MANKRTVLVSWVAALSVLGMLGCDPDDSGKENKTKEKDCAVDCGTVLTGYTCDEAKLECNCHGALCGDGEECTETGCVGFFVPESWGCPEDCNAVKDGYTCDEAKQECNCKGRICGTGAYCTQEGCVRERGELFVQSEDGNLVLEEGGTNEVRLGVTLSMAPVKPVYLFVYPTDEVVCKPLDKGTTYAVIEPENWETGAVFICKASNNFTNYLIEPDKDVVVEVSSESFDSAFHELNTTINLVVKDMDEAKIEVEVPENLYTSEDGESVMFNVWLAANPVSDCTLDLSVVNDDGSAEPYATLNKDKIVFTSEDYMAKKSIEVTGVDDGDRNDQAHTYHVIIRPGDGCEGPFKDMPEASVGLVNLDNDATNILTDISSFVVKEEGTRATLQVKLSPAPEEKTTVKVETDKPNECGILVADNDSPTDSTELVFDKRDGNYKSVTIIGVDDKIDDGDAICHITLTASSEDKNPQTSSDGKKLTITGKNEDDDTADILGFALDAKTIYERNIGGTNFGTMTLSLATEPTADVKFALSANNNDGDDKDKHVMLSINEITFTPQNYSTPQLIFYIAVWDQKSTGNKWIAITEKATSEDKKYHKWDKTVKVKLIDEDVPGLGADVIGGTILQRGSSEYKEVKVVLGSKPTKNVVVTATSSDEYSMEVAKEPLYGWAQPSVKLTFKPEEWLKPQSLFVFPRGDYGMAVGDLKVKLDLNTTSQDPKYWNLTADIPEFTVIEMVRHLNVECSGKALCSGDTTTGKCVISLFSHERPYNQPDTYHVSCSSSEVGYFFGGVFLGPENDYSATVSNLLSKKCAQKVQTEHTGTATVTCEIITDTYKASGSGTLSYGWNDEPWD
ncbi:MAG: hypothetical protein II767_09360 [Proteobacteria bacterium]|nr:hypothetical protein [Pseudomonadota bacterium]MBQ4360452.1 hypothetical protein [Pseudomonadota bacterium]